MKICTIEKKKKIGEIGYNAIYTWELYTVVAQSNIRDWCSNRGLSLDDLVDAKNNENSFEIYSVQYWNV